MICNISKISTTLQSKAEQRPHQFPNCNDLWERIKQHRIKQYMVDLPAKSPIRRAKIGPQIYASIPKQGRQQYPASFKDPLDLIF
jgi:hypothetical protein